MNRSLLTRIATGTLGLALIALAATSAAHTAHADDPIVITPTTPTTVGLPPAPGIGIGAQVPKPDLVVKFQQVSCSWNPENASPHIALKVLVINMANTPAVTNFFTAVKVDGVMAKGSPTMTPAPLWATDVFHLNVYTTPGMHDLYALTDSTFVTAESNETNNTAKTRILCPASAS